MDGTVLRELLQEILPADEIIELALDLGVIKRQRKRDIVAQVASLVLSTGSDDSGRFADAYRRYLGESSTSVVRGAFYSWLDDKLSTLLESLLDRAIAIADAEPVLLPPICRGCSDWVIVDSETVTLRGSLEDIYPGSGSAASIKVHKDLSVGRGVMAAYHFSPGKEHDCPHLVIDDRYRGKGLLIDLGYVSLDFIQQCTDHDVQYVMRLKSGWQPRVTEWHQGTLADELFDGMNFQFACDIGRIVFDGEPIDADVVLGQGKSKVTARLVGIAGPDGYLLYLTNLMRPDASPANVAELYRVRWEIEIDNKLDKSCGRLDQVRATTESSLKILLLSSLLHSVLVDLMVHRDRLRCVQEGPGCKAPLHRQLTSMALREQHAPLVEALVSGGTQRMWDRCAVVIEMYGRDPNWRRRPSVLDCLVGLCASPGRPRKAKQAECPASSKPYRGRMRRASWLAAA